MGAAVIHHIDFAGVIDARAQNPEELVLEIIARARTEGRVLALPYAGRVKPKEAWQLFTAGAAQIVDVRTNEERKFVGHVPGSLHVAWQNGTSLNKNPRFIREVEAKVRKDSLVFLLCRSGKRSDAAATALLPPDLKMFTTLLMDLKVISTTEISVVRWVDGNSQIYRGFRIELS